MSFFSDTIFLGKIETVFFLMGHSEFEFSVRVSGPNLQRPGCEVTVSFKMYLFKVWVRDLGVRPGVPNRLIAKVVLVDWLPLEKT